jgi:hypothetical protein
MRGMKSAFQRDNGKNPGKIPTASALHLERGAAESNKSIETLLELD